MELLAGFAPIAPERPRILVLGTMPSVASLGKAQYYGHPRNAFWPIQFALAQAQPTDCYEARCRLIRERGIALWDVLAGCQRAGSLDAAIRNPQPNDIGGFLIRYPTVRAIAFNGGSARKLFARLVQPSLQWQGALLTLPSTSPAYTLPFAEKLLRWQVVNEWL